MRTVKLGAVLCGGLLVLTAADDALARGRDAGRTAAARKARVVRIPYVAPVRAAYVSAPKRTAPPTLALRPDFSEGEWGDAMREQLSPNDLAGASVTMNGKASLDEVRVSATLSKMRERRLQDPAALSPSSLDQPLTEAAPQTVELPVGLDLSRLGFTITQKGE